MIARSASGCESTSSNVERSASSCAASSSREPPSPVRSKAPGRSVYFTLVERMLAIAEEMFECLSTQREASADVRGLETSSAACARCVSMP